MQGKFNASADYLSEFTFTGQRKHKLKITDRIHLKKISIDVMLCTQDNSMATLTNCDLQSIPLMIIAEADDEMAIITELFTAFSKTSISVISYQNPLQYFDVSIKSAQKNFS